MDENIFEIETDLLEPNPLQPRGVITPESLIELVDSIREQGIVEPLVVSKTPAGYQIIAGERRWRAAKILGLQKVPVVVKESTPRHMLEMSIVENIQREDLNPIERGQAYRRLIDDFGMTVGEIATRVGKSVPYVSNTLRLLSLPDAIKDALAAGVVVEGQVRPLLALGEHRLMLDAFKTLLREGGSVRMAEDLARRMKDEMFKGKAPPSRILAPELEALAKELSEKLSANVRIIQSKVSGRVSIIFKGLPEQTSEKIKRLHQVLRDAWSQ